jgi:hypothetical protein
MIEALIIVGGLWLALAVLLTMSLRERRPYVAADNRPVRTWPTEPTGPTGPTDN